MSDKIPLLVLSAKKVTNTCKGSSYQVTNTYKGSSYQTVKRSSIFSYQCLQKIKLSPLKGLCLQLQ